MPTSEIEPIGGVAPEDGFNPYDVIPEVYGLYSGNQDNDAAQYADELGLRDPDSDGGVIITEEEAQLLWDHRTPVDALDAAAFHHDVNALNVQAEGFGSIIPHVANDLGFAINSLTAGVGGFFSELSQGNVFGAFSILGWGVGHALAGVAFSVGHAALGAVTGVIDAAMGVVGAFGDAVGGVVGAVGGFFSGLFGGGGEGGDGGDGGEGGDGGDTDASFYGEPYPNPFPDPMQEPFPGPGWPDQQGPYVFDALSSAFDALDGSIG